MSSTTGFIFGFVICWLLHWYLPSELIGSINKTICEWSGKIASLFSSIFGAKHQAMEPLAPDAPLKSPDKNKKPDDLKKIEGIGPKIAGLLNDDGILSYKDLSGATLNRLKGILEKAGSRYRVADPTTWPEQAKLTHKGDKEGLKALQDKLKGGRRTS